jgi:ribonuclease HII
LDEAGRGPLAGPVCAAAVILPADFPVSGLNDSKKLSAAAREKAAMLIRNNSFSWGLGWASHTEIDELNILKASLLAMRRAFLEMLEKIPGKLSQYTDAVRETVVDGLYVPDIPAPCRALVRADGQIPAVMAASILAKTARDAEMCRLAALYPLYRYDKHKGYPTKEHRELIIRYGPSPVQRLSFTVR